MADKLPPEQLAYQRAHIDETRQPLLYGIFSMLAALTIIFTGLRLLCRRMRKLKLGPDDIACIFAMCFFLGTTVTNFIATYNGVGRHEIVVTDKNRIESAKNGFAGNIVYTLCWPTSKLAILLMYRRLFVSRWFVIVNTFMIALMVIYIVSTVPTDIFSCLPVGSSWQPDKPKRCINFLLLYQSTSGANIILDLIILSIPVPIIWKLKTTATQKVGLSLVFGVGIIACISSIMRIVTTARVDSNDSSYQSTEPLIWAATELSTSVIAASMPCLLPIVYKFRNGCRRLISTLSSGTRSPVQGSLDNPSSGKKKGVKVEAKEVPGSGENSEKNQDGVELRSFEHVHRNSQRNDGFEAALDLENGTISEEKDEKTLT